MQSAKGQVEITTARAAEELDELRPVLRELPGERVDADPDFFLQVLSTRDRARPHVVAVTRGDDRALFVGRIERTELRTTVGYRTVLKPSVQALTLAHGGFVDTTGGELAGAVFGELMAALRRGEADVIQLSALRVGSPLHSAASTASRFQRQPFAPVRVHRRLELPASYEEFLKSRSRSTRESVKRYTNRLLRDHGDELEIKLLREPADLDRIVRDLDEVASKTYQRGLGVAFDANERERTALGLERGWFRVWVLYRQGQPIAFWPGWVYGGTLFIGTPGYDPAYGDYRVGQYLQMRMTEDLCADPEVGAVDYGFGDAEYKRRFGTESWEEQDVVIFRRSPRGLALNAARAGITGAVNAAKRLLGGERVGRLKRAWRRRLSSG
jgi:Acetyltransferase (GNAT) domain